MNDLRARLLAAFQDEHRAYVAGIRTLLGQLDRRSPAQAPGFDEGIRQAHSLRAAARACDFFTVEAIGERLEAFLKRLQGGTAPVAGDMLAQVGRALDMVEAWGGNLQAQPGGEEPVAALALLDRLPRGTAPARAEGSKEARQPADLEARLRAAFEIEQREHLEGIRAFLGDVEAGRAGAVDEAFRRAHSLKGAARLAGLAPVEELAHRLENLFARVRGGAVQLTEAVQRAISRALDALEDVTAALLQGRAPADTVQVRAAIDQLLAQAAPGDRPGPTAPAPREAAAAPVALSDSVRVEAAYLDRLLRSTGQFLGENMRQGVVATELAQLGRKLDELNREWDTMRASAPAALRTLQTTPGLAAVARYVSRIEQEVRSLARQARAVGRLHQHSARTLGRLGRQLQDDVRRVRLVPAASVFFGFRKMMRDLAAAEHKEVDFKATGLDSAADRLVLQRLKDAVMHALCNAVNHGIEPPEERRRRGKPEMGQVSLHLETAGNRLRIVIEDDGRGIDLEVAAQSAVAAGLLDAADTAAPAEVLRALFQPGVSTATEVTELAGRGMGLSVVHEAALRLQGEARLEQRDGAGTRLVLSVPLSIVAQRVLLVTCRDQVYAMPLDALERLLRVRLDEIETVAGRPLVLVDGQPLPLVGLAQLLGLADGDVQVADTVVTLVLVHAAGQRLLVAVDALYAERESVIQQLDAPASQAPLFGGGIVLEDGRVALVLSVAEMARAARTLPGATVLRQAAPAAKPRTPTVLIVDDSLTTRTLEKSLLEANGYQVRTATDGVEALALLRDDVPDLVITDLQMPRLDGFGLLAEMKQDARLSKVPVIVLTSMEKREDQERGLALGADAYLVKKKFDHQELLATIRQIV